MEQAPTEQAPTEQAQVPPTEAAEVPSEYIVTESDMIQQTGSIEVPKKWSKGSKGVPKTAEKDIKKTVTLQKPDIVEIVLILPSAKNPAAVLEQFFVLKRKQEKTLDESAPAREIYKGEGKKALCYLINKLVSEGVLTKEGDIELEAQSSKPGDWSKKPAPSESLESLQTYLKDYPGAQKHNVVTQQVPNVPKKPHFGYRNEPVPNPTPEQQLQVTASLVEAIRRNRKLIAYYETYGFEVVPGEDEGFKTLMRTKIGTVLNACNPKGAGRKTTRRRRRTRRTRRHA